MKQLHLDTSFESYLIDQKSGQTLVDAKGNKYRTAQDVVTGDVFAKICETLPGDDTPKDAAHRASIIAQNPVHFVCDVPGFTGYWIPVDPSHLGITEDTPTPTPLAANAGVPIGQAQVSDQVRGVVTSIDSLKNAA